MKEFYIWVLLFIFTISSLSVVRAQKVVEEGLVAYWSFDKGTIKGATIEDLSKNKQNAKIIGNLKTVKGKFGDAIKFDNNQNNYIQGAKSLKNFKNKPTQAISVEAWVVDEGFIEWGGYVVCAQDNGSFEKGWVFGTNNNVSFAVSTKEPDDGNGVLTYVKAAKNPNRGEWFHIAGTYDGKEIKVYINGELVAENKNHKGDINYPNAKDPKDESDAELVVGQYRDKNEFFPHHGLIDEVKIYNRALSGKEIKQNMESFGLFVDDGHKLATHWTDIKKRNKNNRLSLFGD